MVCSWATGVALSVRRGMSLKGSWFLRRGFREGRGESRSWRSKKTRRRGKKSDIRTQRRIMPYLQNTSTYSKNEGDEITEGPSMQTGVKTQATIRGQLRRANSSEGLTAKKI